MGHTRLHVYYVGVYTNEISLDSDPGELGVHFKLDKLTTNKTR